MIRRGISSVCVALLAILPSVAWAAVEWREWSHFAPLELQGRGTYKAVFLTEEVYKQATTSLADLRLVDGEGNLVPYYLQAGFAVQKQGEAITPTRLTERFQGGDDSFIEYVAVTAAGIDPRADKLIFSLPPGNYVKHLEVYGSHDGVKWQLLTKDYLYQVEGKKKDEIMLGKELRFSHYRIRILDNVEKLQLGEMKLVLSRTSSDWQRYEKRTDLEYEVKTQQQDSVISIKNPSKLRLKQLILAVEGNFQRTFGVYADERSGYPLQSGEVYNLQFSGAAIESKTIVFKVPPLAETVVVRIQNRDDRPLVIKGIQGDYYIDKLVFAAVPDAAYRLYFGNLHAEKPRYELEVQRSYIEQEQQDYCELRPAERNEQGAWWHSKSNKVFTGAIVAVSLLLVLVLVNKLNTRKIG